MPIDVFCSHPACCFVPQLVQYSAKCGPFGNISSLSLPHVMHCSICQSNKKPVHDCDSSRKRAKSGFPPKTYFRADAVTSSRAPIVPTQSPLVKITSPAPQSAPAPADPRPSVSATASLDTQDDVCGPCRVAIAPGSRSVCGSLGCHRLASRATLERRLLCWPFVVHSPNNSNSNASRSSRSINTRCRSVASRARNNTACSPLGSTCSSR
jgi:hypothetical protein